MFSITIITGLASLFACLCMAAVCAAQIAQLFAAAYPAKPVHRSWDASAPRPRLTPATLACAA